MIHRDLCDPSKTKLYSPLRMQFYFVLSRYVCWDGLIPLTYKEIAKLLKCDIQSIYKFVKKGIKDNTLALEGKRLYLLKRVGDFKEGYVKHFPFLESNEFRRMNVHTQRFVLYALWYGVHSGRPFKRPITSLYHCTPEHQGVLNLYSKAFVYPILDEAKNFLDIELSQDNEREFVRIHGLKIEYAEQSALHNMGEQKLLDNTLCSFHCDDLISEQGRESILKLKKYYVDKFGSFGSELLTSALEKLLTLHKVHELDFNQQLGFYLKSILSDLEVKLLPVVEKCIYNAQKAIEYTRKLSFIPEAMTWVNRFETQFKQLASICQTLFHHSLIKT